MKLSNLTKDKQGCDEVVLDYIKRSKILKIDILICQFPKWSHCFGFCWIVLLY